MESFLARFKAQVGGVVRFLETYPVVTLIVAFVILVFSIATMREKKTTAGSWITIVIACILIMWALGCLTGLGFTMSF